jgi:hypothetical protein
MRHLSALVLLAACSADESPTETGDPDVLVGTFEVELNEGYTSVLGAVYDGPQPSGVVWDTAATDGACALLEPRIPFCSTACGSDAVCVDDETCQAYSTKQSVGTVDVDGVATADGAAGFAMQPIVQTYQPTVALAYPGFAEGDAIRFAAAGSDFTGGFTLAATGIAPLEVTSQDLALARDQPLALTWTAPAADAATVTVALDISHHGGTRGKIVCAAPDTGSLAIAAPLVTELLDLGAAGYPTIILGRELTGSTVISAGRVDLVIASEVELPVTVPGVQSCTSDDDCPDGQTCRDDLTCG